MKPIVLTVSLALAALSLYASDPPAQGNDDSKPTSANHTQTVLSASETVSAGGDSPLVQAAKAGRRSVRKSTTVITNETLVRVGGQSTMAPRAAQQPVSLPHAAGPTWDQMVADQRKTRMEAEAAAAQARKVEEQKKLAAGRRAAYIEGDVIEEQPALVGMPSTRPTSPTAPSPQQKPPQ